MRTCRATIGAGMCQNTYSSPSPPDAGGYPHLALALVHLPLRLVHLPLWVCRTSAEQVRARGKIASALHYTAALHPWRAPVTLQLRDALRYPIEGTQPRAVRLRARGACLAASARTRAFNLPGTKRYLVRSFIWQKARTALYLLLLVRRTLPARLLQASALVLQNAGPTFLTANRSSRGAIEYNLDQSEMVPPSAPQLHAIGRPWRGAVDAEPPRHSVCADRRVPHRSGLIECSAGAGSTAPVTPRVCVFRLFQTSDTLGETWRTARVGVGTPESKSTRHQRDRRAGLPSRGMTQLRLLPSHAHI
jgi:hypothetical protein